MRAWLLGGGICLFIVATEPAVAATRVAIQELKDYPERYYGATLQLECHFDKESPIWVRAMPDADEWIGFFVTGRPEQALTWSSEYYNLLFAPVDMRESLRSLRGGDKITVVGEGFPYRSTSVEGVGIRVQEILRGWGPSAKAIGESAPAALIPPAVAAPNPLALPPPMRHEGSTSSEAVQKYAVTINGKRYEGLRFGDRYDFDGTEFRVDETP